MILTRSDGLCYNVNQEMQMPAFGPDFSPNHDPYQACKLPLFSKINSSIVFCTVYFKSYI